MQRGLTRVLSRTQVRFFSNSAGKVALVCGGSGALGKAIVQSYKTAGWRIASLDYNANSDATVNFLLDDSKSWKENTEAVIEGATKQSLKFDSVVNVAGGWGGDTAADSAVFETFDHMMNLNLRTAVGAAHISTKCMNPGGLLVLTGASPVYHGGTGFMLSYGISKAGVHQIVKSLVDVETSGLPKDTKTVCVLPTTIDTPSNRSAMPGANFDTWTRPEVIAQTIVNWSEGVEKETPRPVSGEFYEFKTIPTEGEVTDYVNDTPVHRRQI